MQNSEMNINYISLHEAAKLTNYSQDYISLLCRQKKIKGIKMGRNWVTTTQWVENYINRTKGSGQFVIPVKIKIETKTKKDIKTKESINVQRSKGDKDVDLKITSNESFNQQGYNKKLNSVRAYRSQIKSSLIDNVILASFLVGFVVINLVIFNLYSPAIDQSLLEYSKTVQGSKNIEYFSTLIDLDLNSDDAFIDENGRVAGVKDLNEDINEISSEKNHNIFQAER